MREYTRTVSYDNWWEMVVEFTEPEKAHEQIRLMLDYHDIAHEECEDIEDLFLPILAAHLIHESSKSFSSMPIIHQYLNETDGFVVMDGTHGMELISIDDWCFEYDEFLVGDREVVS